MCPEWQSRRCKVQEKQQSENGGGGCGWGWVFKKTLKKKQQQMESMLLFDLNVFISNSLFMFCITQTENCDIYKIGVNKL